MQKIKKILRAASCPVFGSQKDGHINLKLSVTYHSSTGHCTRPCASVVWRCCVTFCLDCC